MKNQGVLFQHEWVTSAETKQTPKALEEDLWFLTLFLQLK